MATPAAVLSVLLSADTADATAKLSKFDRQVAATTEVARKGIDARLGGTFDGEAFSKYQAATERAARVAKDRAAFKAELGANFSNKGFLAYQRGVDQAAKSTETAAKHTSGLTSSLKGLTTSLLAAGGAFAAFEVAKEAITSTLDLGHATERLSAATGLDTKTASTWIETMKVRGVQTKAVGQAFITLSRNVRNAQDADTSHITKIQQLVAQQKIQRASLEATGASHAKLTALEQAQQLALDKLSGPSTNKAVAAFAELGVSQDTLRSKNTEKILLAVADGMSKIEDPTRRAAIAQQIFGRGAQGLIPILDQGSRGVEEALAVTQRYGAYLPQNAKLLKGSIDAQHNLNLAMDGLKISFTEAVLPSLVQGAKALLGFIGQMRSGQGAGGQFASVVGGAFKTLKSIIGGFITGVGGLGNAVKIAVGAFAAYKIVAFGNALVDMFNAIKANPIGLFFTAVGLLAGAFISLSGSQRSAAATARDVANAWDTARNSADRLRDANLQVVQAKLNHIKADQALQAAQAAVTKAADQYGQKSPQYRQAEENLAQAKIDSRQASSDLTDAIHGSSDAQKQATADRITAIATARGQIKDDQDRIQRINTEATALMHQGGQQSALTGLRKAAQGATTILAQDQQNLNEQLNAMPGTKLTDVKVQVDFASNIPQAITQIGQQLGVKFHPLTPTSPVFAHHYSGGLVNQPGYFAGEEAPQHPEVILATNPAYRQRNLGLFAQAGKMLGVPGFAQGGAIMPGDASIVQNVPPWTSTNASAVIKGPATSFAQGVLNQAASLAAAATAAFGGSQVPSGPGLTTDNGHPIAEWIEKILQWARSHGWTGSVNSGYRSFAQQKAIYDSGVRPAAVPGTSHHEGINYPDGAVDVSQAAQLSAILQSGPYGQTLQWAGSKDPVHFSHPYGAGYRLGGIFDKAARYAQGGVHWPHWPSGRPAWDKHDGYSWWVNWAMHHGKGKPGSPMGAGELFNTLYGYFHTNSSNKIPHDAWYDWHGKWDEGLTGYRKGGLFGIPGYAAGGVNFQGPVSTFGPPLEAAGRTAFGRSSSDAGISLRIPGTSFGDAANRALMGHLFDVFIGSHQARLMDIDLGPADFTGRNIDVTGAGATKMGINPRAFPTGAIGRVAEVIAGALGKTVPGIAQKAKKYVPSKHATASLPSKATPISKNLSDPVINGLIGQINDAIDPNTGSIAALLDRISVTGSIDDQRVSEYQAANPNTDTSTGLIASTVTDPVTGQTTTAHTLDQAYLAMRVGQLQQLIAWQTAMRDQLKQALARIQSLMPRLTAAIAARKAATAQVRDQINTNLATIARLTAVEKQNPKMKAKQKSAIDGQISALKGQNKTLGGEALKIGTGGALGQFAAEITSLGTTYDTMNSNQQAIIGASGIGGTLGSANLDLQTFTDQLNAVSPAAAQAALAAAAAADKAANAGNVPPSPAPDPTLALLQQLLDQAHLATSVSESQLAALQATPPFGGSFAAGGVVPGMPGQPRTIIAHGGEVVGQPGSTEVHVHVADGMGWLRDLISVEVNGATRTQARNASRALPGNGRRY